MAKRIHHFACKKCGKNVVVEVPDEVIPIGHPHLVGFFYPNLPHGKCLECGLTYIPQIQNVAPTWIWFPFEEQTESGLVIPGGSIPKVPLNRM